MSLSNSVSQHVEVDVPKNEVLVDNEVAKKRHLNVVFIGHVGKLPNLFRFSLYTVL